MNVLICAVGLGGERFEMVQVIYFLDYSGLRFQETDNLETGITQDRTFELADWHPASLIDTPFFIDDGIALNGKNTPKRFIVFVSIIELAIPETFFPFGKFIC